MELHPERQARTGEVQPARQVAGDGPSRAAGPVHAVEPTQVELRFQEEALHSIAKKAIQRRTGARGLRSILEGILLETMFDLPALKGVEEVVIGPEVVEGGARPLRIYTERAEEKGSTA